MKGKYTVLGSGLLALSFLVWLLVSSSPAGVLLALPMIKGENLDKYITYIVLGVSELILIVPLIVYMAITKTSVRALMGNRTSLKQNLLAIAIGILLAPAMQGVSAVFSELFIWLGAKMPDTSMLEPNSIGTLLVGMVAIGAAAGVVEEPIFRGVLLRGLGSATGRRTAIILSALVFSLIHLEIVGAPTRFIIGLLLGYMAWRTGAILPGIITHAAYNSTAIGMSLLLSTVLPGWNGFQIIPGATEAMNGIITWILVSIPFIALLGVIYWLFARSTPATSAWNERPYAASSVKFVHFLPWIGACLASVVLTAFTAMSMWMEQIMRALTQMTNQLK